MKWFCNCFCMSNLGSWRWICKIWSPLSHLVERLALHPRLHTIQVDMTNDGLIWRVQKTFLRGSWLLVQNFKFIQIEILFLLALAGQYVRGRPCLFVDSLCKCIRVNTVLSGFLMYHLPPFTHSVHRRRWNVYDLKAKPSDQKLKKNSSSRSLFQLWGLAFPLSEGSATFYIR